MSGIAVSFSLISWMQPVLITKAISLKPNSFIFSIQKDRSKFSFGLIRKSLQDILVLKSKK